MTYWTHTAHGWTWVWYKPTRSFGLGLRVSHGDETRITLWLGPCWGYVFRGRYQGGE